MPLNQQLLSVLSAGGYFSGENSHIPSRNLARGTVQGPGNVPLVADETLPAAWQAACAEALNRNNYFNPMERALHVRATLETRINNAAEQVNAGRMYYGDSAGECRCLLCVATKVYYGASFDPTRTTRQEAALAVYYLLSSTRNNAFFNMTCLIYSWDDAQFREEEERRERELEEEEERRIDDDGVAAIRCTEGGPVREGRGRLCGVEWEFNSVRDARIIRDWARKNGAGIHSDGSCGWEAVTPPMGGRAVARILTELATAFRDSGARINEQCGIHVHVDARDYMWDDIFRLLKVWSIVESAMFLLGGQARANNTYCYPCGSLYANALGMRDRKGAVLGVAYCEANSPLDAKRGRQEARARPGKKHYGRYKSLNLCPWLNGRTQRPRRPDSTIEFRLHRNSSNGWRVTGFAQLCVAIVDWCANNGDAAVEMLPKDGLKALAVIAPHLTGWLVRRVKAWRKAVKVRARTISFRGGMVTRKGRMRASAYEDDGDAVAAAAAE